MRALLIKSLSILILVVLCITLVSQAATVISITLTASINCFTSNCQGALTQGDTVYWTAWAPTGSFVYNGNTIGGAVYGSFNDGTSSGCGASSNIGFMKLTGIDFVTPSNGGVTHVNCMTSFQTGASNLWPPAAPGTCSATHVNGCQWKSDSPTSVNGKIYWHVFRQDNGSNAALDSTFIVSGDNGATWANPVHIGSPNANGDAPTGPGSADYPANILFPQVGATDGSGTRTGRISFAHYCKDESVSCPTIDGNQTYTYLISESGNYAQYYIGRWPKTSMATLDISTLEWYKCITYATAPCDGSVGANWDANILNGTNLGAYLIGAMFQTMWDESKQQYIGVGFDGGNGTIYQSTAPHLWGPWTFQLASVPNCTIGGCSVFNAPILPTLVNVSSTHSTYAVVSNSKTEVSMPDGTMYFHKMDMLTAAAGGSTGLTRIRGNVSTRGTVSLGRPSTNNIALTLVNQSNTQAIISYTAPSTAACTVIVSESATYSPSVNDTNSVLFTSADQDDRDGNLGAGTTTRVVVLGRRAADLALNSLYRSRALQTNTLHYVRVACGSFVGTTTFTTNNIPVGGTWSDIPKSISNTAVWQVPSIVTNSRTQTIIDQYTGAFMKPLTIQSDSSGTSPHGFNDGFGGFVRSCGAGTQVTTDGKTGVVCVVFSEGPEVSTVYFIEYSTGLVRNLGHLAPSAGHIEMAPNMCYIDFRTGGASSIATKYCYIGDWQEHYDAGPQFDGGTLYSNVSLSTQLTAFDVTYDASLFPVLEAPYSYAGSCNQFTATRVSDSPDKYGWIVIYCGGDGRAYNPSCTPTPSVGGVCPGIVAAFNPMANVRTAYCGNHNLQVLSTYPTNPTVPTLVINWHGLTDNSQMGNSQWRMFLNANVMSGASTITVTAKPVNSWAGTGAPDTFPNSPPRIGDIFDFPGGVTRIVTSVSGSAPGPYTLGINTATPTSYMSGTTLNMSCNAENQSGLGSGWEFTYWNFLADPHGTDTTNTNLLLDEIFDSGGHHDHGLAGRLSEGWPQWFGSIWAKLNGVSDAENPDSPFFHGLRIPCFSSACIKHPSLQQTLDAPSAERVWASDQSIFNGGELFFGPNTNPAVLVSGSLYRYRGADDSSYTPMYTGGLWRKVFPTIAVTGARPYLDISGPGSSIGTSVGDNWKYCVAYIANECRSGSSVGDIFFNAGLTLDYLYCTSGDTTNPTRKDICIAPSPAHSNSIPQLYMNATSSAEATQRSRILAHGVQGPRQMIAFPIAKPIPNASWMLFYGASGKQTAPDPCDDTNPDNFCNLWILKTPPFPTGVDAYNRSDFIPINTGTITGGGSVNNALVKFGYLEHGTASQFYCTSRAESCYVNRATINAAPDLNPFSYPVDGSSNTLVTLSGVSCASTCTIDIPALSGHVLYYQIIKRDASNNILSTGSTQIVIVP